MNSIVSQLLVSVAWLLPSVSVWVSGILVALVRWPRHPQVSALLVGGLGLQIVAAIASRIAFALIIDLNRGTSFANLGLYLGVLQLFAAIIRTFCWAAVIAAIFGWRNISPGGPPPLQFSIRGLVILTLVE